MKYLADTHIALWYFEGSRKLPMRIRLLMESPIHVWYVSIASLWEIAIKNAKDPARFSRDPETFYESCLHMGFRILPVEASHACAVARLPFPSTHKDPFDRMLYAQAASEGMVLVTHDGRFAEYGDDHVLVV